jgi:hypothetical protein
MLQQFRRDYTGEYVISKTTFRNGIKIQDREWLPNPVLNEQISQRAAVIISDQDKKKFDINCLARHRGGLLGRRKLQSYGTSNVWRSTQLDFYVGTDDQNIKDIVDTRYYENSVVLTNRRHVLEYPGKFYLIPYSPRLSDPAAALYAACFDYHTEIFVIGVNKESMFQDGRWQDHVGLVMDTYFSFQFYFLGVESNMPDAWRRRRNFRTMNYRKFVTYCDL